jgi:hypothetical protein
MSNNNKWYEKTPAIVLLLIFFFPVGLYLMWKYTNWAKGAKIGVSVLAGIVVIVALANPSPTQTNNTASNNDVKQETAKVEPTPQPEQKPAEDPKPQEPAKPTITTSQKNAVNKAKSYLDFAGFSHDGLVAQLEYDKYSNADAVYGADNAGADWNVQAAKKAKSYMEFSSFSRQGLIDQLVYDKFTTAQATHGADSVGL